MQRLTNDQYTRLLETERVILIAASSKEHFYVHKGFLALHSTFFAKVVDKPSAIGDDGQASFEIDCAATAIKIFVRWCYEGQFHSINIASASKDTLNERKNLLIDLWIFGEKYEIAAMQNEAIDHLAQVLTVRPQLLTRDDLQYTFTRTSMENETSPLRHLVVMITAIMLEVNAKVDGEGNVDKGIAAYEMYAQGFPGFMSLMHKWQRAWLILNTSGKSRTSVEKLPDFVAKEGVNKFLLVQEESPEEWVLKKYGLVEEREMEMEVTRNQGKEVEVIVLDD